MSKYSALSLIKHAFSNNKNWQLAIKDAEPKKAMMQLLSVVGAMDWLLHII